MQALWTEGRVLRGMSDVSQLTERDILIRIDTKMEVMETDVRDLKERVTKLERSQDREDGFWTGAKAIWGLILALPSGAAGTALGAWLQSR